MITGLAWVEFLLIVYSVTYSLVTLVLLALSLREMAWYARGHHATLIRPDEFGHSPTVTLIVPAHNEETLIVQSATAFLGLDYPKLEVLIVSDGSSDGTLTELDRAFDLVPLPLRGVIPLETARIRAVYISRKRPELRVVDKDNGGKSDAINAGLCVARGELVALTDADGLLEPDAIKQVVRPYEIYPESCVAVGGAVAIVNGSTIEDGRVNRSRVVTNGVVATQVLEYLRGFMSARIAWAKMNGLLITSGAFGVFRRDLLIALGGLSKATLGEDMEITMRLHHQLRPRWKEAAVHYAPDAICWTECPTSLTSLRTQRIRWHIGLLDDLRLHRAMFLRRKYGAAGTLAFPYAVLYEALAPVLQFAGYVLGIVLVVLEPNSWKLLASFLVVTILFGQLLNMTALLIAEIGFHRYSWGDLARLSVWGLAESVWYQPAQAWWRTKATVLALTGHRPGWGTIPRGTGITVEHPIDAVAPLTR
jgi:cellulose synthase/poly-beta-1,6-N-acetylglucosamine synthase-like glycosyltransferase